MPRSFSDLRRGLKLLADKRWRRAKAGIWMMRRLQPLWLECDTANIYRFCTPSRIALRRAQQMFEKEPDTITWIKSFEENDIFYDIGANVGIFSIYAAVSKRAKVYAFEPAFHNYYLLNRNILLNHLEEVYAYNIALSDSNGLDCVYMTSVLDGAAGVNLELGLDHTDCMGVSEYKQPIVVCTLDKFVNTDRIDFPTHIKIDVDGLEPAIINGGLGIICDKRLKSLLVEVNEADQKHRDMVATIKKAGFHEARSDYARYQGGRCINYTFRR